MKVYPSIGRKLVFDHRVTAFDKLDGSNIRAEWSRKRRAFYKFGARNRLMDESDPILGGAKQLILDKYGDDLSRLFLAQKWQRAVAFFEYWSPNTFAGRHRREPHTVTLIDVAPDREGLLAPQRLLRICGAVDMPRVVHEGPLTSDIVDQVKEGTLSGVTFEGVVCKYEALHSNVAMFKIKSRAWLAKLRELCGTNEALFRKLA